MKIIEILTASNINGLKLFGSYFDVKNSLEKEIDNKLGVNGWESLFFKIQKIKKNVQLKKELLSSDFQGKSFKDSKKWTSEILNIKITAKGWNELKRKVNLIISVFCSGIFDPYEYYERTKLKKFKDSSKLEGIDIEFPNENTSLESVLAKYRR